MENKENTINKVDKVTETLIKELEGLSDEGLHEFFMFVYKMNHSLLRRLERGREIGL